MRATPWLALVLCLASCARANREGIELQCPDAIQEVPDGESRTFGYYFPEDSAGDINCFPTSQNSPFRCDASINVHHLNGRSWYISQDKTYFGHGYNMWAFQLWNVQCPPNHYLHLYMQNLEMACGVNTGVTVRSSVFNISLCNEPERRAELDNGEFGIFIPDGNADIEFCSDANNVGEGFVLRATCFDPVLYNYPGCVSYDFFLDWDPGFVNRIKKTFEEAEKTIVPHKRSAEEYHEMVEHMENVQNDIMHSTALADRLAEEMKGKEKREIHTAFEFEEGTEITYKNNILKFSFPDGTEEEFLVACLSAYNSLYGSRVYTVNATRQSGDRTGVTCITFHGPGTVDIFAHFATLKWTAPDDLFEIDLQQARTANRIYDYIYNEWMRAYLIIDEVELELRDPRLAKPFPMIDEDHPLYPPALRKRGQIGALFPEINNATSQCRQAVVIREAPLYRAKIDPDLFAFCDFFAQACDPVLRIACCEILYLNPYDK